MQLNAVGIRVGRLSKLDERRSPDDRSPLAESEYRDVGPVNITLDSCRPTNSSEPGTPQQRSASWPRRLSACRRHHVKKDTVIWRETFGCKGDLCLYLNA